MPDWILVLELERLIMLGPWDNFEDPGSNKTINHEGLVEVEYQELKHFSPIDNHILRSRTKKFKN